MRLTDAVEREGEDDIGSQTMSPGQTLTNRYSRPLAWLSLGIALAYFAWRGVRRAVTGSGDLKYGYTSGSAWLDGLDPYDPSVLTSRVIAGGSDLAGVVGEFRNVYPPPTVAAYSPLGLLTWEQAQALFMLLGISLVAFVAIGLVRFVGWPIRATSSIFLAALVVALAPVHTTLSAGQPNLIALAAIVAAMLAGRMALGASGQLASGVLYGVSALAKIQLGLPFLAYMVGRRRWAAVSAAFALLLVFSIVAIGRMEVAHIDWLRSWSDNLVWSFGPDGFNSAAPDNDGRRSLVNLQYPIMAFVPDEVIANAITFAYVGLAAMATLWLAKGESRAGELLALSIVSVLTLMVTYHRFYDAVLLALPAAWGIWAMSAGRYAMGALVILLVTPFLVPGQTLLSQVGEAGWLPEWIVTARLWDIVVLAHHSWALLALSIVLLVAAYLEGREPFARAPTDPRCPVIAEPLVRDEYREVSRLTTRASGPALTGKVR